MRNEHLSIECVDPLKFWRWKVNIHMLLNSLSLLRVGHILDNFVEREICWELKERNVVLFDSFLCYRLFRIASLSKIFPTLMLYRLWEDGKIGSLDDPLEKYVENFTIKNPLGKTRDSQLKYVTDGLIFLDSGEVQIRTSSVTLRRMASQLSGTFTARGRAE